MLGWLKRQLNRTTGGHEVAGDEPSGARPSEQAEPQGSGMSQAYLALHKYLADRYANVVVLTFAQMEDLLDSPLPAVARRDLGWWNSDDHNNTEHSNSWRLAKRTARANLMAQTVTFERA
jgi:hypothetical protein